MVFEGARENWEADLAKREAAAAGGDPREDGTQAFDDWINGRAEKVYDFTPAMRRRDARLGWGIVALAGSAIIALCAVAAMQGVLGEELHKPVLPTWHGVKDNPYMIERDPCPADNPIYEDDGFCTNAAWQKATYDMQPATKADIATLQAEIDTIMFQLSGSHFTVKP